jgi:hypothetical protein
MTLFLVSTLLSADDFINFVLVSPPDPLFPPHFNVVAKGGVDLFFSDRPAFTQQH